MKILAKTGNDIAIVAQPSEQIFKGDYLLIREPKQSRALLVQVYDETYVDSPGILEEIVRDEIIDSSVEGLQLSSIDINSILNKLRDLRIVRCKIRGSLEDGRFTSNVTWLPSRVRSKIEKIRISDLFLMVHREGVRQIPVGEGYDGESIEIFAEALDGRLTVITGRKESGKSHLAKLLISRLAEHGAVTIVFDLNGEYSGLAYDRDGHLSTIGARVLQLEPGSNMKFTLTYLGEKSLLSILKHTLDTPGVSMREFIRIWRSLKERGSLTIESLGEVIQSWRTNEFVRDALTSRFYSLLSTRLFTDRVEDSIRIEDLIFKVSEGGVLIISLKRVSPLTRRIVVELVLSKLTELLERDIVLPVFLFAEEAHLYLRETYWNDLITRMRHYGVFTTFITNQPDSIGTDILRQVDNLFIFNFINDSDLELLSRCSSTDSDTIRSIVKTIPQGVCLAVGRVVSDLPILIRIYQTKFVSQGETKKLFLSPNLSPIASKKIYKV